MKNKITKIVRKIVGYSLLFTCIGGTNLFAKNNAATQSMTIEQCYEWSKTNYPIIKQMEIIDKTTAYNISNATSGNLPQISLNGQASYQSEVIQFPFQMPGVELSTLDKDQYKAHVDVYQPLTNFIHISNQKKINKTNGKIEKKKIEIEFLKLKDRINQIFFGSLLIAEKSEQLKIIQIDIDSALVRVDAGIVNGTTTKNDRQLLQVEKISLKQQIDENRANQDAFLKMLSTISGKNITSTTQLVQPQSQPLNLTLHRPELALFSLQSQALQLQKKQVNSLLIPNIGIFGQGGYGKPGLNVMSNDFEFYYIGGVKFSWNISVLYNHHNNKKLLNLANENIEAQKETFLLNTNLTQLQQSAEVEKYETLLVTDEKITTIRQDVVNTAKVQLENGLITTIDYIKILNDLKKAQQTMILHKTQLLLAQQNLKNTTGN